MTPDYPDLCLNHEEIVRWHTQEVVRDVWCLEPAGHDGPCRPQIFQRLGDAEGDGLEPSSDMP